MPASCLPPCSAFRRPASTSPTSRWSPAALSLGIGFGLQNIVSNFVSGLILLAERPFKVGDWVVAGTNSGMVKKISVRATEIETFQRQTVIVPNSEFINSAVGNWTHRNKLGRVDVKIGVAYGTDARRAAEVMDGSRAQPPAGAEEPRAVRGVPQFRAGWRWSSRCASSWPTSSTPMSCRTTSASRFSKPSSASGIEIPSNPRAVDPRFAESRSPQQSCAGVPEETPAAEAKPVDEIAAAKARRRRAESLTTAFSCRSASFSYKVAVTESIVLLPGNRGGGDTGTEMLKICAATLMLAAIGGQAIRASAVNLDNEPRTLIVTEGGSKSELAVAAGETVRVLPERLLRDDAERRPRGADRLGSHRDFRRPGEDQVASRTQACREGRTNCPAFYLFR